MTVADVEARALPRPVLLLVGLAAGLLVVSGLRNLSDIIGPAFLALVLTIAAQPLRDWAVRMGLPQWVGGVAAARATLGRCDRAPGARPRLPPRVRLAVRRTLR